MIDTVYKLGIDEIDAQHEHWIYLMDAFKNAVADHLLEPGSIDAAKKLLSELLDYTRRHFDQEEELFVKYNYPHADEHILKHSELEGAVKKLYNEINANNTSLVPIKLNFFTSHWLSVHILKEDADFAKYILEHGFEKESWTP